MVKTGLDRIDEAGPAGMLDGRKLGLIVNPASVDGGYRHAADVFHDMFDIAALFGPQHGIRGETQDNMIEWKGFRDGATGLPVYSLYGEHRKPSPEMLEDLDAMVFDVPDVGTRIYTFIWTMTLAMRACAGAGIEFVVLDRPNPIGGREVEGNVLERGFESFVGLHPIPMRHGMTAGELALMFAAEFEDCPAPKVIEMKGWGRDMLFGDTGLPWVMPSPNMPTVDTALVYPGTVLFEGTNVSEGRGTTRPFELVGTPWVDAGALAETLEAKRLPGVFFRPCHFQPTFHKHAGEVCGGVQLHVTDPTAFRPFVTALHLLCEIRRQDGEKFEWKQPPYEYEYEKLPIDVMFGCEWIRKDIEAGAEPGDMEKKWAAKLEEFTVLRKKYLLY